MKINHCTYAKENSFCIVSNPRHLGDVCDKCALKAKQPPIRTERLFFDLN